MNAPRIRLGCQGTGRNYSSVALTILLSQGTDQSPRTGGREILNQVFPTQVIGGTIMVESLNARVQLYPYVGVFICVRANLHSRADELALAIVAV